MGWLEWKCSIRQEDCLVHRFYYLNVDGWCKKNLTYTQNRTLSSSLIKLNISKLNRINSYNVNCSFPPAQALTCSKWICIDCITQTIERWLFASFLNVLVDALRWLLAALQDLYNYGAHNVSKMWLILLPYKLLPDF